MNNMRAQIVRQQALVTLLLCLFHGATAGAVELVEAWTLDGFKDPESAVIDLERAVIYVSNVNQYAKDGNGAISRVSLDGSRVEREWITGVHSPTGVALYENKLYFADYDALVIVDVDTGVIEDRIEAPDKDSRPSLNDVAVSDSGEVYVSGSRSRAIYRLAGDLLQTWYQDDVMLQNANGLLVDGQKLIHAGLHWQTFDRTTASVIDDSLHPGEDLADFDGIMAAPEGGYLVTTLEDPRLWHVSKAGSRPVNEAHLNGIDLDVKGGYLALPRVGGLLTLYRIQPR